MGVQLVRFAKPPTLAVTNPPQAVIDVAEDTTTYHAAGDDDPRRHGHDHRRGPGAAVPGLRGRRRAAGSPTWSCAAGGTSSTSRALDPETGKTSENDRAGVHHGAVPRHRGAHARRSNRRRRARSSRTARSRCGGPRPTPRAVVDHGRPDRQRRRHAHRDGSATVRPVGRRPSGSAAPVLPAGPDRRADHGQGRRRRHLRHAAGPVRGQVADRRHRHLRRGQGDVADAATCRSSTRA